MSAEDIQSLSNFQKKWDQMCSQAKFQKQQQQNENLLQENENKKPTDANYWLEVARVAKVNTNNYKIYESLKSQVLTEAGSIETPNPILATTLGPDSAPRVTPGWNSGEALEKIIKMKGELHDLGDKLASANVKWNETPLDITEKQGEDVLRKIIELSKKIDELTKSLTPGTADTASLS